MEVFKSKDTPGVLAGKLAGFCLLLVVAELWMMSRSWIATSALMLFWILLSLYVTVKEYRIKDNGEVEVISYLGVLRTTWRNVSRIVVDRKRGAVQLTAEGNNPKQWYSVQELDGLIERLRTHYPEMEEIYIN